MSILQTRYRPGQVRDAIVSILELAVRPLTLGEIVERVNARIGPTPPSSVRSYLGLNTPSLFLRHERGSYELRGLGDSPERPSPPASPDTATRECLGNALLVNADCLDWIRRQPDEQMQAVVTDPPYGLFEYSSEQQDKMREKKGGVWRIPPSFDGHVRSPLPRFTVLSDDQIEELRGFFFTWARALLPKLVPGANVIVASNPLLSYIVAASIAEAGFERRGEIIRLVMTMRGGDRPKDAHEEFRDVSVMPRSMWEPWLVFRRPIEGRVQDNLRKWKTGGFRRPSADRPFGDVIRSSPTQKNERAIAPHPSLKPQAFLRQVVRAVLPLGEGTVLDPFAGAGSTLAAAEAVGYVSIGVEKDARYFSMACEAVPRLARLECAEPGFSL